MTGVPTAEPRCEPATTGCPSGAPYIAIPGAPGCFIGGPTAIPFDGSALSCWPVIGTCWEDTSPLLTLVMS